MYLSTAAEPGANPGVHGFAYAGCYVDSVAARVLSRHATVPGGATNMSVAACTGACRAMGYALAGLEWAGGMCWGLYTQDTVLIMDRVLL